MSFAHYIGTSDLSNTNVQSIYAIKDDLGTTTISNIRAVGPDSLVKQIITNGISAVGAAIRTATSNTVNFTTDGGWYIDLPDSGERVNVEMKLQLGTLIVASNVPDTNACDIGGYSWLNYFDYGTGSYVPGASDVAQKFSNSLLVGINVVRLPNGKVVVIGTAADNTRTTVAAPFSANLSTGERVNWREILE